MQKRQQGFSVVEALIILFILGVLGVVGLWVYKSNQNSTNSPHLTNSSETSQSEHKDPSEVLKEYKNEEYGISFKYPSDWKLKEDMTDIGRGAKEGEVTVTSPNATAVTFDLNQGGKGGDCVDDLANDRTTRICDTVTIFDVEKLPVSPGQKQLYFYHVNVKASDNEGGKTEYSIGISDREPEVGAELSPLFIVLLSNKKGNIEIRITGKEDSKNTSEEYFTTQQISEAAQILKSFTIQAD